MQSTISLQNLPGNLQAAAARLGNIQPVLRAGRILAVAEVKTRFDKAQGPDGKAWPPLKHSRPTGGNKPLLSTGLLRASITGREDQDSITIGTARLDAPTHQFGATIRPKRGKFLAIPATKEAMLVRGARNFPDPLSARIGRSGRGGVLLDPAGKVQFYLARSVTIPARPFIGWSREFLNKFEFMVVSYIITGSF